MSSSTPAVRPVVLIECAEPEAAARQSEAFFAAGFSVRVCPGPRDIGEERCELLRTERCHLVDGADVVFHDLDLDRPEDQRILDAIRTRYPELPVVVETPVASAHRHRSALDGCAVIPPISPAQVVLAARATLG